MGSKRWSFYLLGFAAALFVLLYLPLLPERFILIDDQALTQIPQLQAFSWSSIYSIFKIGNHIDYYPLRDLSYLVDIHLFGASPMAFRAQNLLWALGSFAYLYLFLRLLTNSKGLSSLLAAIWLLSPYHVEMLAWISGRKDIMALFFGLLAAWSAFSYLKKNQQRYLWISGLAFLVGVFSKASLGVLPLGLLAFEFYRLRRTMFGRAQRDWLYFLFATSLIAIGASLLQGWFYSHVNDMRLFYPATVRILGSLEALGKMFVGLFYYPVNILDVENWGEWVDINRIYLWPGVMIWLGLIAVAAHAMRVRDYSRLLIVIAFLCVYLPISALLFPHRNFYSVRYFEPAFLVILAGVAYGLSQSVYFQKELRRGWRTCWKFLAVAVLCWQSYSTYTEANTWAEPLDVRKKAVSASPASISLRAQYMAEIVNFSKMKPLTQEQETEKQNQDIFLAAHCMIQGVPKTPDPFGDPCWNYYFQKHHYALINKNIPESQMFYQAFAKSFEAQNPKPRMIARLGLAQALMEGKPSAKILSDWRSSNQFFPNDLYRTHAFVVSCYLDGAQTAKNLLVRLASEKLVNLTDVKFLAKNLFSLEVQAQLTSCYP